MCVVWNMLPESFPHTILLSGDVISLFSVFLLARQMIKESGLMIIVLALEIGYLMLYKKDGDSHPY